MRLLLSAIALVILVTGTPVPGKAQDAQPPDDSPWVPWDPGNVLPEGLGQPVETEESLGLLSTTRQTLAEERDQAQDTFLLLYDAEEFERSVEPARRVVEISQRLEGPDHPTTIVALTNLATVQRRSGDLAGAEANYLESVSRVERQQGFVAQELIPPLNGLASTYRSAGMYERALETDQRALKVNHIHLGFYNEEQAAIRNGMSRSYLGMEKLDKANFHQETMVMVSRRNHGELSPLVVPSMQKLAGWYRRTGQAVMEQRTYRSAVRLLQTAEGTNDEELVTVLRGLANAYMHEGAVQPQPSSSFMDEAPAVAFDPMADASRALKKALEIIDSQDEVDHLARAEILLQLGDLYNTYDKTNKARDRYQEAWQTLSRDESLEEQRYNYFDKPRVIIRNEAPTTYGLSSADLEEGESPVLSEGFVLARYRVDKRGRVKDIEILESSPPGVMDRGVTLALRKTYFQPRFADGEPVDTNDMLRRHEFRYPSNLEEPETESGEPEPKQDRGRLENPAASLSDPD